MSLSSHAPTEPSPAPTPTTLRADSRVWPFWVELALLLMTAPTLYFPTRVHDAVATLCNCDPTWLVPGVLALLLLLWPLRRALTGQWVEGFQRVKMAETFEGVSVAPQTAHCEHLRGSSGTSSKVVQTAWSIRTVAWALGLWFVIMLPVAVWAAPAPLDEQYAWPRALILVWNFSLFWSVLTHASRTRHALGWAIVGWLLAVQGIALLAPFGMEARTKLPGIGSIQELIPRPLLGVFSGAEAGFSTNQVAGVLLFVLPLLITLWIAGWRVRTWQWWLLTLSTGWIGATLVLTQSRGGLLGLLVALVALLLLTRRWGWWALAGLTVVGGTFVYFLPTNWLAVISDAPGVEAMGGVVTVSNFRRLVWDAGNSLLRDFAFTGIGLGTFRVLVYMLYPMADIPPTYDLAHAHNFFLQTALDFGVPGLVAFLVLYAVVVVQLVRLAHAPNQQAIWPSLPFATPRVLAIGWMGCLVGQTVYSLFDVVAMGSKPNFVWWWWMALMLAAANLWLGERDR